MGKLKTAAKSRKENLNQEEVLSQAFSRHALSREILGCNSSLNRRSSLSPSGGEGVARDMERAGGEKDMRPFVSTQITEPQLHGSSFSHLSLRSEPMQLGVSTAQVDDTPSLSVKCHSQGGDKIDVTVSGNAHESVKVELAVSDAALLPVLMREKGAILRKLREAGHTIGDVSLVSGKGSSSAKERVDCAGYRRRKGGDDDLAVR